MRIDITRGARSDLEEIHDQLEAQREGLGKTMVLRFQQSLERIEQFPRRYAKQLGNIRV